MPGESPSASPSPSRDAIDHDRNDRSESDAEEGLVADAPAEKKIVRDDQEDAPGQHGREVASSTLHPIRAAPLRHCPQPVAPKLRYLELDALRDYTRSASPFTANP